MSKLSLLLVLFLFCGNVIYSQNLCNCIPFQKQIKETEFKLEKKDFEAFSASLKTIKSNDGYCQHIKLALSIDALISQNEVEKADSVKNEFQKIVNRESCVSSIALLYYSEGALFLKQKLFDSATARLIRAQDLSVQLKDTSLQLKIITRLARCFKEIRQPNKAVEYDKLGIKLSRLIGDDKQLVQFYGNLCGHFGLWYDVNPDKKHFDSIKKYFPITIKLARKINASSRIAQCFSILAGVVYYDKAYNLSLSYCDSSLSYLNPEKHFTQCAAVYQKKCDNYIELKKYDLALKFANLYLVMNKKEGDVLLVATAYERLYEVYKLIGKTDEALRYHERMVQIRDSIRTQEVTETVNDMEQKYHKSENEKEINKLNYEKGALHQQKEIDKLQIRSLIGIVATIVLLLIVIVFFYRQSIIKSKLNTIEIEQRLNRARMNPHFFFNALASLQNLSLSDTKKELVPGYISKFSKIMRQSLESTFNELDTIENEISFLTDYLELQKLRSENRFDYEFDIDDLIETNELLIPGMILQPFIENSIEHGFKNLSRVGHIKISFFKDDKNLRIVVLDNGQGIKDNEKHKNYPSRATQIIKDRLYLLNKKYKCDATYQLASLDNDMGIMVTITLPIIAQR